MSRSPVGVSHHWKIDQVEALEKTTSIEEEVMKYRKCSRRDGYVHFERKGKRAKKGNLGKVLKTRQRQLK